MTAAQAIARERTIKIAAVTGLVVICTLIVVVIDSVLISFVLALPFLYARSKKENKVEVKK